MLTLRFCFVIGIAILAGMASARELVNTQIEVTLLKSGKPLAGATISSCVDHLSQSSTYCESPVLSKTDARGRATLVVATGIVQPPYTPGMPPSTSDPTQAFWFKVLAGADSREFYWISLGFGIPGRVGLVCDVDHVARAEAGDGARRKFQLPLLQCGA